MNEQKAVEILKRDLLCNKKFLYDLCSDVECDECDLDVPPIEFYDAIETVVEYMERCIK